eukprot:gene9414-11152_t
MEFEREIGRAGYCHPLAGQYEQKERELDELRGSVLMEKADYPTFGGETLAHYVRPTYEEPGDEAVHGKVRDLYKQSHHNEFQPRHTRIEEPVYSRYNIDSAEDQVEAALSTTIAWERAAQAATRSALLHTQEQQLQEKALREAGGRSGVNQHPHVEPWGLEHFRRDGSESTLYSTSTHDKRSLAVRMRPMELINAELRIAKGDGRPVRLAKGEKDVPFWITLPPHGGDLQSAKKACGAMVGLVEGDDLTAGASGKYVRRHTQLRLWVLDALAEPRLPTIPGLNEFAYQEITNDDEWDAALDRAYRGNAIIRAFDMCVARVSSPDEEVRRTGAHIWWELSVMPEHHPHFNGEVARTLLASILKASASVAAMAGATLWNVLSHPQGLKLMLTQEAEKYVLNRLVQEVGQWEDLEGYALQDEMFNAERAAGAGALLKRLPKGHKHGHGHSHACCSGGKDSARRTSDGPMDRCLVATVCAACLGWLLKGPKGRQSLLDWAGGACAPSVPLLGLPHLPQTEGVQSSAQLAWALTRAMLVALHNPGTVVGIGQRSRNWPGGELPNVARLTAEALVMLLTNSVEIRQAYAQTVDVAQVVRNMLHSVNRGQSLVCAASPAHKGVHEGGYHSSGDAAAVRSAAGAMLQLYMMDDKVCGAVLHSKLLGHLLQEVSEAARHCLRHASMESAPVAAVAATAAGHCAAAMRSVLRGAFRLGEHKGVLDRHLPLYLDLVAHCMTGQAGQPGSAAAAGELIAGLSHLLSNENDRTWAFMEASDAPNLMARMLLEVPCAKASEAATVALSQMLHRRLVTLYDSASRNFAGHGRIADGWDGAPLPPKSRPNSAHSAAGKLNAAQILGESDSQPELLYMPSKRPGSAHPLSIPAPPPPGILQDLADRVADPPPELDEPRMQLIFAAMMRAAVPRDTPGWPNPTTRLREAAAAGMACIAFLSTRPVSAAATGPRSGSVGDQSRWDNTEMKLLSRFISSCTVQERPVTRPGSADTGWTPVPQAATGGRDPGVYLAAIVRRLAGWQQNRATLLPLVDPLVMLAMKSIPMLSKVGSPTPMQMRTAELTIGALWRIWMEPT